MKKFIIIIFGFLLFSYRSEANQWIIFYSQKVMINPVQFPHAFATFYQTDPVNKNPTPKGSWGFHPINVRNVFDKMINEGGVSSSEGAIVHNFFVVEVTEKEFNIGISLAAHWNTEDYNVFTNNCVTFIKDILKRIKLLDLPPSNYLMPGYVMPGEFIEVLKLQNREWEEHSILSYRFFRDKVYSPLSDFPINPDPATPAGTPAGTPATSQPATQANGVMPVGNLMGGASPEDLGKLILKAVKTNDQKLYSSLVHPHPVNNNRGIIIDQLHMLREGFPERGLSDWNLVRFSRVIYDRDIGGGYTNDKGIIQSGPEKGEQVRRSFKIEFQYKGGFIGTIESMTIITYKGKYFIYSGGGIASLDRF